ncbi:MAG: SPOR domain-containing protein, partial [Pseudomonadota bacterium]
MRTVRIVLAVMLGLAWGGIAAAQSVFVQVEAYATEGEAARAAAEYAEDLDEVNGFRFTTGWYVIALGPYDLNTAASVLNTLKSRRQIPSDAYLVDRSAYSSQFFPPDGRALTELAPPPEPEAEPETEETAEAAPEPQPEPEVAPEPEELPEETRREALRSEGQLSRQEKFDLQIALQWFGFY